MRKLHILAAARCYGSLIRENDSLAVLFRLYILAVTAFTNRAAASLEQYIDTAHMGCITCV